MIWIPGFENRYSVTADAQIFSHYSHCVLKPKSKFNGYKYVGLYKNGKRQNFYVHRLIAFAFHDLDLDSDLEVDHIDRDRGNNTIDNLRVVTKVQNRQHTHGRLGLDTETHKYCCRCEEVLPRSHFGFNKYLSDNQSSSCLKCRNKGV